MGRLATKVAYILQGKHKPTFNKSIDDGDHVVVINMKHAVLTGKKWLQKKYRWHTGWPGGLKVNSILSTRFKALRNNPSEKHGPGTQREYLKMQLWGCFQKIKY